MNTLMNLNDFLYHSTEILICDIQLTFLRARRFIRAIRIARLEAQLASMR